MRAVLAGLAAAGLVAAGTTAATGGTVTRPYTVTISHGGHKTTYRCHTAGVTRGRLGGRGCIPVLRPRVTLDAQVASGGSAIYQDSTSWYWRVVQSGTPGILTLDHTYTAQGYTAINDPNGSGLFEIQLTNHGGAYQNDCVTWNASLTEFDAIGCAWKVSQEWNTANNTGEQSAELQNWYTKNCAQADDTEGEGSAIQSQNCGFASTTVWDWNELGF